MKGWATCICDNNTNSHIGC